MIRRDDHFAEISYASAMIRLTALLGDITTVECDAIVNAANSSLLGGGGVDGAIHQAAGPTLLDECRAIVGKQGGCDAGDAVITGAGALPAQYVIHTVGPIWHESDAVNLDEVLASCYRTSLDLAAANGVRSIAFPNISTGVYGYPKDRAAGVAIATVEQWISDAVDTSVVRIYFVCFDTQNLELYNERLSR